MALLLKIKYFIQQYQIYRIKPFLFCLGHQQQIQKMQLPEQILKKIRILTDKPISPILNKQLYPLLLHEHLSIPQTLPILTQKYRCDLLIYLLQNNRYPPQSNILNTLSTIHTQILQYKTPQVIQLYLLILPKLPNSTKLLEVGYTTLMKLAIKHANLETKEFLFQLLCSNIQYFYSMKFKSIMLTISANFIELYSKFLIYVPSYPLIMHIILKADNESKLIMNKEHPERQPVLEDIIIDLSSQQLSKITIQTCRLLENIKNKQVFVLQKNCLMVLRSVGEILKNFRVKESELNFTGIQIGKIIRCIEIFSERKGVIDEARLAKGVWMGVFQKAKSINSGKMEKIMDIDEIQSIQKPMFIEDVISMTNNYRLKYHVQGNSDQQSKSRIAGVVSVTNNYLKKKEGAGGGKTFLLTQKQQVKFKEQKSKNFQKYDHMVMKCLQDTDRELQIKSFVNIKPMEKNPLNQIQNWQVEQLQALQNQRGSYTNVSLKEVQTLPVFTESIPQKYKKIKLSNISQMSSRLEDENQFEQISNLIDLAYSYKFS